MLYEWFLLGPTVFTLPLNGILLKHNLSICYVFICHLHFRLKTYFCEHHSRLHIIPPFESEFLSRFPVSDTIQLTFSNSTKFSIFNSIGINDSSRHYPFESTVRNKFDSSFKINFTPFYYFIQLPLHPFDSPFPVQLIFSGYILLIIYDLFRLIYSIWFDTHYMHWTHCFWFELDFLI